MLKWRPVLGVLRRNAAYARWRRTMAKPLPLPVWDRQRGTLLEEWIDDHQPHYESEPQRSFTHRDGPQQNAGRPSDDTAKRHGVTVIQGTGTSS
jgi:hypothetical protein